MIILSNRDRSIEVIESVIGYSLGEEGYNSFFNELKGFLHGSCDFYFVISIDEGINSIGHTRIVDEGIRVGIQVKDSISLDCKIILSSDSYQLGFAVGVSLIELPELYCITIVDGTTITMMNDYISRHADEVYNTEYYHDNMPGMTIEEFQAWSDHVIREVRESKHGSGIVPRHHLYADRGNLR